MSGTYKKRGNNYNNSNEKKNLFFCVIWKIQMNSLCSWLKSQSLIRCAVYLCLQAENCLLVLLCELLNAPAIIKAEPSIVLWLKSLFWGARLFLMDNENEHDDDNFFFLLSTFIFFHALSLSRSLSFFIALSFREEKKKGKKKQITAKKSNETPSLAACRFKSAIYGGKFEILCRR